MFYDSLIIILPRRNPLHILVIFGRFYKAKVSISKDQTNLKVLWVKIATLGFPRSMISNPSPPYFTEFRVTVSLNNTWHLYLDLGPIL
jgi:hypothetical protein